MSFPDNATKVLMGCALLLAACSDANDTSVVGSAGAGAQGTGGLGAMGGGASGLGGGFAGLGGGTGDPGDGCLIYIIDHGGRIWSFDPLTLQFKELGTASCGFDVGPMNLAIARDGTAYVSEDYSLADPPPNTTMWTISLKDAACTPTSYVTGQLNQRIFGLAFVSDGPDATTETLYASAGTCAYGMGCSNGTNLAKVALPSFQLSLVGDLTSGLTRAILTGTGAGHLFGVFCQNGSCINGQSALFAEIDKETAGTPSSIALPDVIHQGNMAPPTAFWGGDFWFFQQDGSVVRYKYATDKTFETVVPANGWMGGGLLMAAGVSTCAPLEPPR